MLSGYRYRNRKIKGKKKMTIEELEGAYIELKKMGFSDDDLLRVLYSMYSDEKIDEEDLVGMVGVLGYEVNPDFISMGKDEKKEWIRNYFYN